jgi:superfamily I DNA and/or RNA helicase
VRTPQRSRREQAPELASAVLFSAIAGEQQAVAGSWVNRSEVDELVAWVSNLLARGIAPGDLGVITPFRAQAEALMRALRDARVPLETARDDVSDENLSLFAPALNGALALGTVHRFQGGERSIILFSTTVTRTGSLRFLDERVNLLNVAASRAKEHLIVLGHEATLAHGKHTRVLLRGERGR